MSFRASFIHRLAVVAALGTRSVAVVSYLLTTALLLCACSEWNTDSIGSNFTPANSQVRNFTHIVYIEYNSESVEVWGPAIDEVNATIDGLHVTIESQKDSLAIIACGYPASLDSLGISDGSIKIVSSRPCALYLSGIALRSQSSNVISCTSDCHVVLPASSKNHLYGTLHVDGDVIFSGTGALTIQSQNSCIEAQALHCQYEVTVTLSSTQADGVTLTRGEMRSSLGSWYINAHQHGISATADSILLLAGTYQGTAVEGSFLNTGLYDRVALRQAKLMAASAQDNTLADVFTNPNDSAYSIYDMQHDTLTFMADSTYFVYRNDSTRHFTKFKPRQTVVEPYFILSDGFVNAADTLSFLLKEK